MAAAPPEAGDGPAIDRSLAAIVVNWRQEAATRECVRRLLAWRRPPSPIVVVDNASGAESVARLRGALPRARVLENPRNLGFGAAVNRGLEDLETELVLLLNNDAELGEDDAAALVEALASRRDAFAAGPVLEAAAAPHAVIAAGGRDLARHGRTHSTAVERARELREGRPYPVDYVPGTAAVLRRRALAELGGFDEEYFFSGEMADLCARAADSGLTSFVVPAARARHDLSAAGARRDGLYAYYSLRNRFLFVRRRRAHPAPALIAWTLRGSFRAITANRPDRRRALAMAVADGLRGRFGAAGERVPR